MKWTIGAWPVIVSRRAHNIDGKPAYGVACKNRVLGQAWKRGAHRRMHGMTPWRAEHARNRAITFHRTMTDAVSELVTTEALYYMGEYQR